MSPQLGVTDHPMPFGSSFLHDHPSIMSNKAPTGSLRALIPGVYVPTVVFFDAAEDLDIATIKSHAVRMADAGVAGIVTQGSNGEAVMLSHKERNRVTIATRQALDAAGFHGMPVIVGCGAQSTRETIELCVEAKQSGGDYALVLAPSYYKSLLTTDSLASYFQDVATASPIPILIYNFPGASAGLDLDSEFISKMARHPNIVGCKLTCGNSGKLLRVASATNASTPSDFGSGFMAFGGSADFVLQTLIAGGSGTIAGLANLAPKACVELVSEYEKGNIKNAKRIQAIVARGDWTAIKGGLIGTKSGLQSYFGYGGPPRSPLPKPSEQERIQWMQEFAELMELEDSL